MEKGIIYDPFFGLPIEIEIGDGGNISYKHPVTHRRIPCRYTAGVLSIPYDADYPQRSISASEAAEMLGVSRMRITQLCNDGKLAHCTIGNSLFVDRGDVICYRAMDRTPGRKEGKDA